jgi:hypothetical protein
MPNSFFVQALVPQSIYDFKLSSEDYRLLWALNCGSLSCVSSIPVYVPHKLDYQLNDMMRSVVIYFLLLIFYNSVLFQKVDRPSNDHSGVHILQKEYGRIFKHSEVFG